MAIVASKSNRFRLAKQQLCMCITLFLYISLLPLNDYKVKWPNFTFFWGRERQGNKINSSVSVRTRARPPLFSSNINSFLLSNCATWIIAKWFERMQSVFFSNVFMDVLLDRKVPTTDPNSMQGICYISTHKASPPLPCQPYFSF